MTPVFPLFGIGGVSNYVFNLSEALSKDGNKVIVISRRSLRKRLQISAEGERYYRDSLRRHEIDVYCIDSVFKMPYYFFRFFYYLLRFRSRLLLEYARFFLTPNIVKWVYTISTLSLALSVLENNIVDVVIGHTASDFGLIALVAGRLLKKTQFTILHGGDLFKGHERNERTRKMIDFVLKGTPLFLSHQDNTTKRAIELGVPERKIVRTISCVNVDFFHSLTNSEIEKAVESSNISMLGRVLKFRKRGGRVILYLGLIERAHGIGYLIKSVPFIDKQVRNILLLLVGPDYEGISGGLRELAQELGCSDKVLYLGVVPYELLPVVYNLADLVALPPVTRTSALHLAALEAQACGRPIVASKYAGLPEVVENGESGIIVNPKNVEELANAVVRVLLDRDFSEKLSSGGRKNAEKHSWDIVVQKINSIVSEISYMGGRG